MKSKESFYLIGIGGIGMSAIAQMLLKHGFKVSGSDLTPSPMTQRLERLGIRVFYGHDASHVGEQDRVIYSSSIREDNPELRKARDENLSVQHRSEALAVLSRGHWTQAVAGTHGKTTTTALMGAIFQEAGRQPSIMVGGKVPAFGGNAVVGDGETMILEADESDASFLIYEPNAILITNIDCDHLDHFRDMDEIYETFKTFVGRLQKNGYWMGCAECPQVRRLREACPQRSLSYGFADDSDYQAQQLKSLGPLGSRFTVKGPQGILGEVHIKLLGLHNVLNALGALAASLEAGVPWRSVQEALSSFEGASRRFEIKLHDQRFILVDDYAHHPQEILMTLKAARQFTPHPILAIFQPHRYSRTQKLAEEFSQAFDLADEVVLTDIYPAGELPIPNVSGEELASKIRKHHKGRVSFIPRDRLADELCSRQKEQTLWITMGAGDIHEVAGLLKESYAREFV